MSNALEVAQIASLVGEPTRANMLLALGDGRALPAGELAACAGIAAPTASEHLAKLEQSGLLISIRQGRHRYYRIASPEVAAMLEAVMVVAAGSPRPAARFRIDPELQFGRTCYNHLAGQLGVAICDALAHKNLLTIDEEVAHVMPAGLNFLDNWGIDVRRMSKHPYCRTCIDWSERRPHLGGAIGIAIHKRCLELKWIEHHLDSRAVRVTRLGKSGFEKVFGIAGTAL
ncbi:MAG: ArsR/SmtB family transcription factor [Burkholderiales bacterium]